MVVGADHSVVVGEFFQFADESLGCMVVRAFAAKDCFEAVGDVLAHDVGGEGLGNARSIECAKLKHFELLLRR